MAKPKHAGVLPAEEVVKMFDLDLKNRVLAALLAWLWPGAGHLYQGRTAKGVLFMLCIVTTFVTGMTIGKGKVAYATPLTMKEIRQQSSGNFLRLRLTQAIDRWPFLCQAGIGTVAIPAVVERERFLTKGGPKDPLFGGAFYPPRESDGGQSFTSTDGINNIVIHPNELAKWNYDLGFWFELGTIYTVVAGLLNILVVYDAYSGPLIPKPPERSDGDGDSNNGDTEGGETNNDSGGAG